MTSNDFENFYQPSQAAYKVEEWLQFSKNEDVAKETGKTSSKEQHQKVHKEQDKMSPAVVRIPSF